MTIDREALRRQARAATSGPWKWALDTNAGTWGHHGRDLTTATGQMSPCPFYCVWLDENGVKQHGTGAENPHFHPDEKTIITSVGYDADSVEVEDADADYIAAVSPDVVLALLTALDDADTRERALAAALERIAGDEFDFGQEIARAALDAIRRDDG